MRQVEQNTTSDGLGQRDGQDAGSGSRDRMQGIASVGYGLVHDRALLFPLAGLIGLMVTFSIIAPNFMTAPNFVNLTREAAVLLIISVGMTYVILQGSIDLSAGPTAGLSGLIAAMTLDNGHPTWLAIAAGVAVGVLVGAVNGAIFAFAKVPSFLATLGIGLVVTGIATWIVGGRPVAIADQTFRSIATGSVFLGLPNVATVALLVFILGVVINFRTKFGRYMFAIGGGESVARLSGVPVVRYKFYALAVCGACAGLGGVLLTARVGAATPTMGEPFMLLSIAAVVMGGTALSGGVGGVHRTLLGVSVMILLRNGLDIMAVGPYVQLLAQGIVIVIAVAVSIDRTKLGALK